MEAPTEKFQFHDDNGLEWSAFEADVNGDRCLFFECAEVFRRVRSFPPDWRKLPPAQLMALSWTR